MQSWEGVPVPAPTSELRRAVAPLLVRPSTTAIVTDFDGTLAPIVDDPSLARPLEGAGELMALLARRFGVVAVVSGRPASFLSEQLGASDWPSRSDEVFRSPRLVGLYGLEWSSRNGEVTLDPAAEGWRPVVDGVVARLQSEAPTGVLIESKGVAVTVHWRRAADAESWATSSVAAEAERTGLLAHPGRMSLELRPPIDVDKGSVIRRLVAGCSAACYFGDDLGDLPAFAELARLASEGGVAAVSVAVVDAEAPAEVAEAADVVVPGPLAALGLLAWLAEEASRSGEA